MKRLIIAIAMAAAFVAGNTGTADAFAINLTNDTSVCARLTVTTTGLSPNTAYQIVADGGSPDVVHNVTSNGSGVAVTTFNRSESSSDSSADWGNTTARTQYGGYLLTNNPAYHYVKC